MLSFELGKPSVVNLAELQVGDFFLLAEPEGPATVGVVAPPIGQKITAVMLSGANAFRVFPLESRYRHSVIKLEFPADSIRLRIDHASAVERGTDTAYTLGNIDLSFGSVPAVVVAFPENAGRAPFSLLFNGWTRQEIDMPDFVFTRWALSYVDEAGQWVDLVRRDAPEGDAG